MAGKLLAHLRGQWIGVVALLLVLTGGTAYALEGSNTVFTDDIVDGQVRTPDLDGGAVTSEKVADQSLLGRDVFDNTLKGADIDESTLSSVGGGGAAGGDLTGSYPNPQIAPSAVSGPEVATGSLTGSDVATSSLSGVDVATDGLSGSDIFEPSLSVSGMGCQIGVVQGFARVKGSASIPSTYTSDPAWSDTKYNCAGGSVQVRRAAEGVYFVRFNGLGSKLALAISNSDGFGVDSPANDNVLSINRITGGADVGAFRIEVEDITGSGTDPEDNWFNIMAF